MNIFNAEKTIAHISLLYELALNSGQSLDLYESCDLFLKRLLTRKNFNYCAVWIRDSSLGINSSSTASLVYSYPERFSLQETSATDNLPFQANGNDDLAVITVKGTLLSSILDQSLLQNSSVICFKLLDFGILFLAAERSRFPVEEDISLLHQVLHKFAVSLQGCLAHQSLQLKIEEQKEINILLHENEARLKQAQSFAAMGVWEYSIAGNALHWSTECGALFGLETEDQFPVNFEDFLSYVHPDDREYVIEVNSPITSLKQGIPLHYEHRIVKKDGEVRWVREEADQINDEHGVAIKILGMVIDITEQKQAEAIIAEAYADLEKKIRERTSQLVETNALLSDEVNERRITEGKIKKLLASEKIITDISSMFVLSIPDNFDQCIKYALKQTGQFHNVDRSYVFLFSSDGVYASNTHEWCAPGVEPVIDQLQNIEMSLMPWWMSHLINMEIINIPCVDELPSEAEMEKEILKAQGNQSVLVVPLLAHGELLGFIGFDSVTRQKVWAEEQIALLKVVADIISSSTVRKRYEQNLFEEKELLGVTLRCIAEGLVVVDTDQRIMTLNSRAEALTGWSSLEAEGRLLQEVFVIMDPKSNIATSNPLQAITATAVEESRKDRLIMADREGRRMNINAVLADIKDNEGRLRGTVVAFQDITEQLKAEAQLALAEKLNTVGQLAAGIAHEINTPMQYIGDNTTFLKDSFEATAEFIEKLKAYLGNLDLAAADHELSEIARLYDELDVEYRLVEGSLAIKQSFEGVERVSKIIGAMKNFANFGTTAPKSADLNEAINNTLTISRNEWKCYAEVTLELDYNLPAVTCDIGAVNQVILNLIINAAQAIETAVNMRFFDRGEIRIATRVEKDCAVIEIADNGVGIAPEIQNKIFDPFFTTKEVGRGTGQGLMIAHNIIVNKHGGSLTFESEEGKGTIFRVKLPLQV